MAVRCPKCGREYTVKPKFCGTCGTMFEEERSEPGPRLSPNRMPEGIGLGIGEEIVKRYKIGRYTLRQGEVSVIVTNKRVIRYEESNWLGMQTNRIDEINIDAVHGTSCTVARSISILGLVVSVVLFLYGFTALSGFSGRGYYTGDARIAALGIASIVAAIIIIINSFKPTLHFQLHGAVGSPVLQTDINMFGRIFGRNYSSVVFQFKPTAETTVMLKEIGACIYDLKVLGDKAIDKWKK